jgi:DNA-binding LacI/PurR family transcriptional regulator
VSASRSTRRPTIVDVARRAGVSKSLVSLVMRGSSRVAPDSRAAVLAAADELGYRPNAVARSLVRQRSGVLGCVLSDLHNPYFADVADGIEEAASAGGYRAVLSGGFLDPSREATAVETLLELQADGLIMLGSMLPLPTIEGWAAQLPSVVIGHASSSEVMDSVTDDDEAGAAAVVDHLVSLGHREIAHIHGGDVGSARSRRRGYERAMAAHGLAARVRSVRGAYTEEGGGAAMRSILEGGDLPTAIFVANDLAALGALDVLDGAGVRVPAELSLVGYDDIVVARSPRVALTTVAQPSLEIGRTAVNLLLERVGGDRHEPRHVVLPPRLVVRGTTAAPGR